MTIKAIETLYKGYKFRSRLEARWAVFFDALGVEWEYEPEGYILSTGEHYLPDFWLPDTGVWVEVKGMLPTGESHHCDTEWVARDNGPISSPLFRKLRDFGDDIEQAVLLGVGLPHYGDAFLYCWDDNDSSAGDGWWRVSIMDSRLYERALCFGVNYSRIERDATFFKDYYKNPLDVVYDPHWEAYPSTIPAALKAKQARFEHGERP